LQTIAPGDVTAANADDSGDGSLRYAIHAADSDGVSTLDRGLTEE